MYRSNALRVKVKSFYSGFARFFCMSFFVRTFLSLICSSSLLFFYRSLNRGNQRACRECPEMIEEHLRDTDRRIFPPAPIEERALSNQHSVSKAVGIVPSPPPASCPSSLVEFLTKHYECPCCLELMQQPISLTCGHSVCKVRSLFCTVFFFAVACLVRLVSRIGHLVLIISVVALDFPFLFRM